MRYLADTNVLSELARANPDPGVVAWAQIVSAISLSVISVEEIFFGLTWKPNSRVEAWFDEFLQGYCEICPVTTDIARRAGALRGMMAVRGQTRTQADMLIAATAHVNQRTLVTRNLSDFEGCGIVLLNPFSNPAR
ncbi:MAG: type II toxin-antitoxin system VapC family toxin [Gammaproteobacteria bacterium]